MLFLAFLFSACKKKKPAPAKVITTELASGLPENVKSVNGYFCSTRRNDIILGSELKVVASFNDPAKDFLLHHNHNGDYTDYIMGGNVDVGTVWFDGLALNKYSSGGSVSFDLPPTSYCFKATSSWKTFGNATFEPLELTITRGYPVILNNYNVQSYPVSISKGMNVDIANTVSNFDSVMVILVSTDYKMLRKSVAPGAESVKFNGNELSVFACSTAGTLKIIACNYSNRIVKNICYVFELISKKHVAISIGP